MSLFTEAIIPSFSVYFYFCLPFLKKAMKLTNAPYKISIPDFLEFVNRPSDFLDTCAERYGDDFTVKFPDNKVFTFLSHPKTLECILNAPPDTFAFKKSMEMFGPLVRDYSLMKLDGSIHLRHRKLLKPPFHGERMRVYGKLICELTEKMMKSWKIGKSINLFPCIHEVTFNVLLNVVFGSTEGGSSEQLRQKATELLKFATSRWFALHIFVPALRQDLGAWSTWGRFLRLQDEFDLLLSAEIAQRREQPQPESTDIFTMLVTSRYEDGQLMSNQELCDEIITMLLTGYDTTSMILVWALYWIHRLPKVRDRLLKEMDTISDPSDTMAIYQLPYLTATCNETLRLYPSLLGFLRVVKTPFNMMGEEFPVGSQIMGNIYSAQRRQEVYTDPEQFKPERFLERKFSQYEYLPFGGANRVCIGNAFAQFQIKLILFKILSQYQLELPNSNPLHLHPVRRASGVMPSQDVRLLVTAPRESKSPVLVG